ncbi:MAG: ferritin family protein [Thermodesulfobacteriota bacterium]
MTAESKLFKEFAIAYNTELDGYAFYTRAAEIISDDKGRNVFTHIAKEEFQHMAIVSSIADRLRKGLGIGSYEEALREGTTTFDKKGLPIFPKDNELIKRLKTNPTDQNAVAIAVEAEEKAVEFYGNMLKHAESPVEKVLFTRLHDMEKEHLKIFRWEYESLTKTGFWCGNMEYSVEKESE